MDIPPMNEPMAEPMMGGDIEEPMGGEVGMGNEDDTQDPKKSIQQLAGELSQALRNYNQQQETPDTDLNKYVMGMVVAQTAKDMTPEEKDEIVKKIQKGNEEVTESIQGINDEPRKDNQKQAPLRKNPFNANR